MAGDKPNAEKFEVAQSLDELRKYFLTKVETKQGIEKVQHVFKYLAQLNNL